MPQGLGHLLLHNSSSLVSNNFAMTGPDLGEQAQGVAWVDMAHPVELAQEVALCSSQHIWVDGSLTDHEWFAGIFDDIRFRFPRYSIAVVHVHCEESVVRARVQKRFEATGRAIPESR